MVGINFDDGMFHFIFGNVDDVYFLDSLLCVDFKKYMYLLLKESGYQYVYFVEGVEKDFRLHILDMSSFALFEKVHKQGGRGVLKSIFKKQTEAEYSIEHRFSDVNVPTLSLIELMKSNERIAVVYFVEALNELRTGTEALKGLEKIAQKYASKHHALIVVASPAAEESKEILVGEDSIFNSDLFPLHQLYQRRGKIQIYKQLSDKYGEHCVHFLNELEAKELKNLVLYHFMSDMSYYGDDLKYAQNMADYIYMLYHSEVFRNNEPIKIANIARRNSLISRDFFENKVGYESMLRRIKEYRDVYDRSDNLLSCWKRDFGTDTKCELMYERDGGWKNSVKEILKDIGSRDASINKVKNDIREEICRITIVNQNAEIYEKQKDEFIEECRIGLKRYKTVPTEIADKMLNALKYVVCDFGERDFEKACGETTEGQRGLEIIELHKTVIEISKLCYNIDERLSELKKSLLDSEQSMVEHRREEEEYEVNHNSAVQNTDNAIFNDSEDIIEAWELANLRNEFLNDYKLTMSTKCSQNSLNELKIRLRHLMDSLESELKLMETIELAQVNSVLSRAMQSIKSNRLNREQLTRELTESTQSYDDLQAVMQEQNLEHSTSNIIKSQEEFRRINN